MLMADIAEQHTDDGGYYFGNGGIEMKILYQQFYKKNIEQYIPYHNYKIPEQLHMAFYGRVGPHNVF
jgi:hypothetical protein